MARGFLCWCTPVPVEPDPETFNIDAERIEAADHFKDQGRHAGASLWSTGEHGSPSFEIARKCGLKVIEDNAQAQGARYQRSADRLFGRCGCHQFLSRQESWRVCRRGCVTTNDAELADRVRALRNYGSKKKYHNDFRGYNSRMDELQAAFLRVKLRRLG